MGGTCTGGRFLADFIAGSADRPQVPEVVEACLTLTADDQWVVWAHKAAAALGEKFMPLTGGDPYPWDAVAHCRRGGGHAAPQRDCTCGFHAVSVPFWVVNRDLLEVALSGRILAFEWEGGGVLFRAARQTVVRVGAAPDPLLPPPDPSGWLAALPRTDPSGSGPIRLRLPEMEPPIVELEDDAGYCMVDEAALATV